MKPSHVFARVGAVLAAAALLLPVGPAGAAPAREQRSDTVVMTVDSITPSTPSPSPDLKPLTVQLTLNNTTDTAIKNVRILGQRGDPIATQAALDSSLAEPAPSSSAPNVDITPSHPLTVDLPAGASVPVTFATTTGIPTDAGLCLCAKAAVYPLFFSAHVTGDGGVDQRLGVAATYLPSFYAEPAPLHVNWVWPLIDRPHRLFDDNVFTDDLLAGSVSPDGRLYRALQVVEDVGDSVPLTLVIDPELLDELEVMATGKYTVLSDGRSVPGTGQAAAIAWLAQFRATLAAHPELQVELTPYADPDIESLSQHGLTWKTAMPSAMSTRVSDALAGRSLDTTVAWPAAGAISTPTLKTLAAGGVSTVVLNSSAVTPRAPTNAVPAGLARIASGDSDLAIALTSAAVEKYVGSAVTIGGPGVAALPQIIAELAVRAAQEPDAEHALVITAPRYVDASVAAAVQTIKDTSRSTFAQPISLRSAVSGALLPTGRSHLAKVPASATTLPASTVAAADHVTKALPAVSAMLDQKRDAAAKALVASVPIATQRAVSSAWRVKDAAATASAYARDLSGKIDAITSGVRIVRPSSGAYTLASSSSPIPITVDNKLSYPVIVRISVTTVVNGLPGFTTTNIGIQPVDGNQKRTLNVPTKTERSGRVQIQAVLLTPNDVPLGSPVPLTVRSTALGAIGVVITVVAGVVLALALLVRLARRFRKRRAAAPEPTP